MAYPSHYKSYLQAQVEKNSSFLSQTKVNEVVGFFRQLFLNDWALRTYFVDLFPAGSFAKGTAISGSSDIDLFLSFSRDIPYDLGELYNKIYDIVLKKELRPRKQRVSIGVTLGSVDVDLVPGQKHNAWSQDHSLHIFRGGSWIKTNVHKQIEYVRAAQCSGAIKAFKIWKRDKRLEFPSFLVELTVIEALKQSSAYTLEDRCNDVFNFLVNKFESCSIKDPGCLSNIVSDDLTREEKSEIVRAVRRIKEWSDFI